MAQPKVSVIILHLKDLEGLLACLASLRAVTYTDFDIILVHNGPRDAALEAELAPFSDKLSEIIHAGENTGFARGNNAGIKLALRKGADYVLLLNDDTVVSPDFLERLIEAAEKNPLAGMLGPEVRYYGDRERISFAGARFLASSASFSFPRADQLAGPADASAPFDSDYITGCALLVKKSLIKKIGPLDERFFLYWEDSDWGLRAGAAGFKNLVVPSAKIWHKVSASLGGGDSPLKAYHKTRSHFLFAELHAPGTKKALLLKLARDLAWLLFKSGKPGAFMLAAAYLAGFVGYLTGGKGAGPAWLKQRCGTLTGLRETK